MGAVASLPIERGRALGGGVDPSLKTKEGDGVVGEYRKKNERKKKAKIKKERSKKASSKKEKTDKRSL